MSTKDLRALITELRSLANDGDAALFDDQEATDWINEGAKHFTLETQILRFPIKIALVANTHEYALAYDEGEVLSAHVNDGGSSTELDEVRPEEINIGSRQTTNRPYGFYVRTNANYLHSRDVSTGADLFTYFGPEYRRVFGVWPIPAASQGEVTIWHAIEHPDMKDSADPCLIPYRYHSAAVYYGVHKAKLKEQAIGEADAYAKMFDALMDKAKSDLITKGVSKHRNRTRRGDCYNDLELNNRRWFND